MLIGVNKKIIMMLDWSCGRLTDCTRTVAPRNIASDIKNENSY